MDLIARPVGGQALSANPLRMGRLLDPMLDPSRFHARRGETWFPPLDVLETSDRLEVYVDLPGIDPDSVDLSIEDDTLVLSGNRPSPAAQTDARWFRFERHAGTFRRSLKLPVPVDVDAVEASSEHGQLRIVLPKVASARPTRITIRGT